MRSFQLSERHGGTESVSTITWPDSVIWQTFCDLVKACQLLFGGQNFGTGKAKLDDDGPRSAKDLDAS